MKDFWAWASAHYLLFAVLAWVALVISGQVLTSFLRIFHRPKLSEEQIQTLREGVTQDLLAALPGPRLARIVDELNREHLPSPGSPPRARPWYDRLR